MSYKESKSGLLGYLFLLTGIFCLLQLSFLLQSSGMYFADVKFIASHIAIPWSVLPGVLFYAFAQITLQVGYTLVIWLLARLSSFALHLSWQRTQQVGFSLWVVTTLFILIANAFYFPNSKYADLLSIVFVPHVQKLLFFLFSVPLIAVGLLALLGVADLFFSRREWHPQQRIYKFLIIVWVAIFALLLWPASSEVAHDAATMQKPNIILIGIDALRPDFLSYFGREQATPHLDEFLNESVVFGEALTPLARTFPSWVSILTGLYPKQTNARFDLAEPGSLHLPETLPAALQKQGYATVYGMDDTRFSNMTKQFGFEKFVTPPTGFNDFFLGSLNDFPLSNLVVNTQLGKWLFPYSYGNRAVYITYEPSSFLNMLAQTLKKDRTKPLFMAVHFCLPHYPYFWGSYAPNHSKSFVVHYSHAIQEMDKQFYSFMKLLKEQQVLTHSIVVLLSDHGEALEFAGDRITAKERYIAGVQNVKKILPHFYPPTFEDEAVDQSAGHGTDVLGLPQYHSVLAFRVQGLDKQPKPHLASGIVSLMQIKPTILNYLHMANEPNGLQDILNNKKLNYAVSKDFFMESDFSPEAVRSVHPETKKLLFEGIDFFQIDPRTTKITIKKSMGEMIISSKQYADIYHGWMLALYPKLNHQYIPILVNLHTGKWTEDLSTPFALHSPYPHMFAELKKFYGKDLQ